MKMFKDNVLVFRPTKTYSILPNNTLRKQGIKVLKVISKINLNNIIMEEGAKAPRA